MLGVNKCLKGESSNKGVRRTVNSELSSRLNRWRTVTARGTAYSALWLMKIEEVKTENADWDKHCVCWDMERWGSTRKRGEILFPPSVLLLFLLSACGSLMFIFRMMGRTRYAGITKETYFNVGEDRPMQYRSEVQR